VFWCLADVGTVRDERNQAHLATTQRARWGHQTVQLALNESVTAYGLQRMAAAAALMASRMRP
jgi:hypothetical protein